MNQLIRKQRELKLIRQKNRRKLYKLIKKNVDEANKKERNYFLLGSSTFFKKLIRIKERILKKLIRKKEGNKE